MEKEEEEKQVEEEEQEYEYEYEYEEVEGEGEAEGEGEEEADGEGEYEYEYVDVEGEGENEAEGEAETEGEGEGQFSGSVFESNKIKESENGELKENDNMVDENETKEKPQTTETITPNIEINETIEEGAKKTPPKPSNNKIPNENSDSKDTKKDSLRKNSQKRNIREILSQTKNSQQKNSQNLNNLNKKSVQEENINNNNSTLNSNPSPSSSFATKPNSIEKKSLPISVNKQAVAEENLSKNLSKIFESNDEEIPVPQQLTRENLVTENQIKESPKKISQNTRKDKLLEKIQNSPQKTEIPVEKKPNFQAQTNNVSPTKATFKQQPNNFKPQLLKLPPDYFTKKNQANLEKKVISTTVSPKKTFTTSISPNKPFPNKSTTEKKNIVCNPGSNQNNLSVPQFSGKQDPKLSPKSKEATLSEKSPESSLNSHNHNNSNLENKIVPKLKENNDNSKSSMPPKILKNEATPTKNFSSLIKQITKPKKVNFLYDNEPKKSESSNNKQIPPKVQSRNEDEWSSLDISDD